jgi:hypothetical protein
VGRGDNIKMSPEKIGLWGVDWIDLDQDRETDRFCLDGNEHSGSIK